MKEYWEKDEEDEELYPIYFDGKLYQKEECNEIFVQFYHCRLALNCLNGVYLAEHTWIYPDGSMKDW